MASEIVLLDSQLSQIDVLSPSSLQMLLQISPSQLVTAETFSSFLVQLETISSLVDYQTN